VKAVENGMAKELGFAPQTAPNYFGRLERMCRGREIEDSQEQRKILRRFVESRAYRMVISLRMFTPCAFARSSRWSPGPASHADGVKKARVQPRRVP
jgi:hypothetical protein